MGGHEVPLGQALVQIRSRRKRDNNNLEATVSVVYGPVNNHDGPATIYLNVEETETTNDPVPHVSSSDIQLPLDRASVRVLRQLFNVLDAAWQITEEDDRRISQAIQPATKAELAKFGKSSQ